MACAEADHLHHVLAKVVELAIVTGAAGFACACCLHLILERGVILACDKLAVDVAYVLRHQETVPVSCASIEFGPDIFPMLLENLPGGDP